MHTDHYVLCSKDVPVLVSGMVLTTDAEAIDGVVRLTLLDEHAFRRVDLPGSLAWHMAMRWNNVRTNWFPGRPIERPRPILSGGNEGDLGFRCVTGTFDQLRPRAVVEIEFAHAAIDPAPRAEPLDADPKPLLYELGPAREENAVVRWLSLHGHQLFEALGLGRFYWCGLFLQRRDVFADRSLQGDVDIIAGPLDFDLTGAEWQDLVVAESRLAPIDTHPSWNSERAVVRALADGRLTWPPSLERVVACEAKASWFEPESGVWKASHTGEGRRVRGQLRVLLDKGLDRVAFLQLGATKPKAVESGHPWLVAGRESSRAQATMPLVFDPKDESEVGYFRAVVGALKFAPEHHAGAGGTLSVQAPAPARTTVRQAWREQLQSRFANLPRPPWPQAFVVPRADGDWCLTPRPMAEHATGA